MVDVLLELYGILIELDIIVLEDVGFGFDIFVMSIKLGILFCFVLKLFLKEFELIYIVKNEVLLIMI